MNQGIAALEAHIFVVLVALLGPVFVRKHNKLAKGTEKRLQVCMPMPGLDVSLAYDVCMHVCTYIWGGTNEQR